MMGTSPSSPRVLVVESSYKSRSWLAASLQSAGFDVVASAYGTALAQVTRHRPQVVLLDIARPGADEAQIYWRLRNASAFAAVLVLTTRETFQDNGGGLAPSGDHCLTKPFSLHDLISRINSLLERGRIEHKPRERLRAGILEMDEDSLEVWRNGEPIRLSATEFKLLRFMMINEERVISKAQILSYVWNVDFASDSRNVEIYVHYLRRKLNLPDEQLIRTIRGVGYQLRSQ